MKFLPPLLLLTAAALPLALLLVAAKSPEPLKIQRLERGRYLVAYGGCTDCHTPKKMTPQGPVDDLSRFLSGHPETPQLPPAPKLAQGPWSAVTAGLTAWSGPWGVSYAANLTPDVNTGLGIWTENMFLQAMRTGRHMGHGRPILPPMPWENVSKLSDDDIKAIYAYLRTIPVVSNRVPPSRTPDGITFEE